MRWGVEVWDRFDEVSGYVHKGIDFCEKYEEFLKKRCAIENSYAKSLRKLIETYEPKKKETATDDNESTIFRCFLRMLDEMRDMAGQHELVAENVQEKVLAKINQVIRTLKDERRKCIEDKERYHAEHLNAEELLEKCKQKCEKSFREVEKAEEQLNKVENDDSASKNDIKKQKAVCDQKKRQYDGLEAEYGKQLCEANRVKNVYFYQKLPAVFDDLQFLEKKRIDTFKDLVIDCVKIEGEVLPRIKQCLTEIDTVARSINSDQDTELVVRKYKTGYTVPPDHIFEDLKQTNSQNSGVSLNNNGLSGTAATLSVNSMGSGSTSSGSRNKKYRTLNRIKGLFSVPGLKSEQESLYDLPPQQLKNELLKKINFIQHEMEKIQKEREGLMKMKEVYTKNQKFGDQQMAEQALRHNEERLHKCVAEMKKYQDLYNQVEQQYSCSSNNSNNSEYSSSSSSTSGVVGHGGGVNGTTMTANNNGGQYQSPSQSSTSGGYKSTANFPTTPVSTNHSYHHHHMINGSNDSNAVAYAVSPVTHLNTTNGNNNNSNSAIGNNNPKMAPLVNSNESFDDEDDDDDDDDEDDDEEGYEENGGYESPIGALSSLPNLDAKNKKPNDPTNTQASTTTTTTTQIGFVYASNNNNNNNNTSASSSTTHTHEPQYDQVDACLYDQPNGQTNPAGNSNDPESSTTTALDEIQIGTALVMYSFDGNVQNSISIEENESLNVLEKDSGDGWTLVRRLNGEKGYVPTDYIRIVYY